MPLTIATATSGLQMHQSLHQEPEGGRYRFVPSIDSQLTGKLSVTKISNGLTHTQWRQSYQLLQVPATDLHVSLIFIHAFSELLRVDLTTSRAPGVILVAVAVGLVANGVVGRLLLGWLSRSATEHSSDGVANG